jgi:tRNA(fMet)-specific endonuclease VapC
MTYILDTSILASVKRGDNESLKELSRLQKLSSTPLGITSPAYSELYFGYLRKSPHEAEIAIKRLDELILFNTTQESSIIMAKLKKDLNNKGKPIPIMDLLIASIVMAHGATLITRDEHFKDIEGLNVVVV